MDELEPGIVRRAECSCERSGPEDTDELDGRTDCAHTSGGQLDRLRKDIEWTKVGSEQQKRGVP
jgi:hypothetical protein